jgi:hypothetical protein
VQCLAVPLPWHSRREYNDKQQHRHTPSQRSRLKNVTSGLEIFLNVLNAVSLPCITVSDFQMAMHRALLLPEIIATILRTESSSPGFLYTCQSINKTFLREASRILWEACGTRCNSATFGHVTPDVQHLASIIQEDPQRGQFYANFIHVLEFDDEGESNSFLDEAMWHKQLAAAQFPYLKEIGLYESQNATLMNTGDVVIHYAQPNITCFTLRRGSRLSDSFLNILNCSCPKLKSLTLNGITRSTVSKDGLVRFLNTTDSLESLNIRTGLDDSWSREAFDVITRYRNLDLLSIPDIQDDWAHSLQDMSITSAIFPKLRHFYTGISDKGLENLTGYMPNLETLSLQLQNLPPSHHTLASASNFTRLRNLTVHFSPQSSVSGHDLVILAQNCPELVELSLGEDEGCRPTSSAITDSTIDDMAQKMPKIADLSLLFDSPDLLTWRSLLSLARYCKNLEMLALSCNFAWQEAVNGAQENIFPSLWSLEIVLDEDHRDGQFIDDSEETINTFAARFATLAPKLSTFQIEGGNQVDRALEVAIEDICMGRW